MTANRSRVALFDRVPLILRIVLAVVGGYGLATGLSLLSVSFMEGADRDLRTAAHFLFFIYYAICIVTLFSINSLRKTFLIAGVTAAVIWALWWGLGGVTV